MLAFMVMDKTYSKYYDEVVILLETGLRISEFCGLTMNIDMTNRIINVDHQLMKDTEIGYYIATPKTKNGIRQLPMTERAYRAFQRIPEEPGTGPAGCDRRLQEFSFLNAKELPKVAGDYKSMLKGLVKKYNKTHTDQLPNITPHSLRHTYCTNMANKGMNPNTLQYIMGHANITMTLGITLTGLFIRRRKRLPDWYPDSSEKRTTYLLLLLWIWRKIVYGALTDMVNIGKIRLDKAGKEL